MSFWLDIAAFALKALLIVAAVGGLVFLITRLTRGEAEDDSEIKVDSLNERYDVRQARLNAGNPVEKGAQGARQAAQGARQGEQEGSQEHRRGDDVQTHLCLGLQGRHPRQRGWAAWGGRSTLC